MDSFHYGASDGESSTSSTSYQQKLKLTTGSLPAGDYLIQWSAEIKSGSFYGVIVNYRVQADDSMTLSEGIIESPVGYSPAAGLSRVTLTAGVHEIDIDWNTSNASYAGFIRRARLMLWKLP